MSGCADQPASRQAQGERQTAQEPEVNKGPDINKQDRSKLREGGELRVPIDSLPSNYSPKQVDGARVVTYQFADAILPSAFLDGADGLPKLNKGLLHLHRAGLHQAAGCPVHDRCQCGLEQRKGTDVAGPSRALDGAQQPGPPVRGHQPCRA